MQSSDTDTAAEKIYDQDNALQLTFNTTDNQIPVASKGLGSKNSNEDNSAVPSNSQLKLQCLTSDEDNHVNAASDDSKSIGSYGYASLSSEEDDENDDKDLIADSKANEISIPQDKSWFLKECNTDRLRSLKSAPTIGEFFIYPSQHDVGNFCLSVSTAEKKLWTGLLVYCGHSIELENMNVSFNSFENLIRYYSKTNLPCGVTLAFDDHEKEVNHDDEITDSLSPLSSSETAARSLQTTTFRDTSSLIPYR